MLYQPCMSLYCLFYALRLYANVALCRGGAAMLQEPLNQGNIIAAVGVDLCCIPLPETMGGYALIAQIVAHKGKLFLDGPFCDGEKGLCASNRITQSVVFQILLDDKGDCENPL